VSLTWRKRVFGCNPAIEPFRSCFGQAGVIPAEQLVIDLAELIQGVLNLGENGQARPRLGDLLGRLQQQRLELPLGEGPVEIKERAVPGTAGMTGALGACRI